MVLHCGNLRSDETCADIACNANRLAEQWDCADFAPFSVQIRNRVFCVKAQITNFHIEKFTAPGCGIVHEDHEYQIPQIFGLGWIRLLKQCSQ